MTITLKHILPFIVSLSILVGIVLGAAWFKGTTALGSIVTGEAFISTTTVSAIGDPNIRILKSAQGSLAQVTITGAAAGTLSFYNATTTDVNARTYNKATSTILLATFPASTAAGTYTFDLQFNDGLILVTTATVPTTTITYR